MVSTNTAWSCTKNGIVNGAKKQFDRQVKKR